MSNFSLFFFGLRSLVEKLGVGVEKKVEKGGKNPEQKSEIFLSTSTWQKLGKKGGNGRLCNLMDPK